MCENKVVNCILPVKILKFLQSAQKKNLYDVIPTDILLQHVSIYVGHYQVIPSTKQKVLPKKPT
jgi:hypothetical protein